MKSAKRIIWGLCLVSLVSFVSTGCSKKDDPAPAGKKINLKVTVTVTGADEKDNLGFQVGVGNHDASQYGSPCWKINGVTQGNESFLQLGVQEFMGNTKTYVLETVKPFDFGSFKVHYSNFDGAPLVVSYKAEVDGKVESIAENISVAAGQSDIKNFTYQGK